MTTYTNIPQDITKLKDEKMDKNNNLSDLADRAAAWLNVRPIGSTPLAGDPVGDYDAATKRWVENKINTGTVGPTMNGVMNYGVGDFHLRDSRAYIQPYEVVSDGQLLNRADWPELWAYAQMVGAIDDSVWLADKFQRGRYSLGDGTTTFRVPDRNGVQQGSIRALYGRGDGGMSDANGRAFESAAPNIYGRIASYSGSSYAQVFSDINQGAFRTSNDLFPDARGDAIPMTGAIAISGRYNTLEIDASRSSPIYGASTDEILTRNFVGVWVIRASGGFVAANTSWSVINGDTTEPANGVVAYGGAVRSVYNIAGAEAYSSQLRTKILFGTDFYSVLEVKGQEGTMREVMSVSSVGAVKVPGLGGFYVGNTGELNAIEFFNVTPYPSGNTFVNMMRGHWYEDRFEFGAIRDDSTHINHVQLNVTRAEGGNKYWGFKWSDSCIDTNLGLIQPGGSDRRLKDKITNITNTEGNTPRDRINRLVAREFEWLSDGRKDRGFIAQEAQAVDELYAFSGSMSGMLNLNDRALLADIVTVVQEQDRELAEVKAELAELRELVNLMVQK
ncbi:tail fiber protein [Phage NBEco002]|uniref:Tail fiber protein n=1 Tax=Phage NBEco002 TaxID=2991863 RepID=A0A6G8QWS3_9CAUD|nr:tail fiber protein [Phage NBEco002]QIN92083.1 tail fiber protein [Phage NBEco002]